MDAISQKRLFVRVLQSKKYIRYKMSNKKYIICMYEEIHCYKIENKLKNIIILKKYCQFRRNEGENKECFNFFSVSLT